MKIGRFHYGVAIGLAVVATAAGIVVMTARTPKTTPAGASSPQRALGLVMRHDFKGAQAMLEPLAERGDGSASYMLGNLFELGQVGPDRDDITAFKWYLRGAEQGNTYGARKAGTFYRDGRGTPRDEAMAAKWLQAAAEKGQAEAQFDLAGLYEAGKGVPVDFQQAAEWHRKAAARGNAQAKTELGSLYLHGKGVPQDYDQARTLFLEAADACSSDAMRFLGAMFQSDQGQPQDLTQAYRWYVSAADWCHSFNRKNCAGIENDRDRLKDKISRENITAGTALAKQWRPKVEWMDID